MLPIYGTYSIGDISSGSELILHPFPVIRVIRAVQIFINSEFSKEGLADLEDEFADGGMANQPVVLQGGVGLSSFGQRESNFQ